jgi:hypothetical protein
MAYEADMSTHGLPSVDVDMVNDFAEDKSNVGRAFKFGSMLMSLQDTS